MRSYLGTSSISKIAPWVYGAFTNQLIEVTTNKKAHRVDELSMSVTLINFAA
ncbi:hypothetical protein VTH8203_04364 [Vibrio thalassae]|uniref:Uncharacterized protein n=1 Tax=Vibrio thalassae TaxID=1243014 RepID=A0A240EQA2_9VIBR|nr:hypothetical protein VTH8203_04364 [Vibrio thalassae]